MNQYKPVQEAMYKPKEELDTLVAVTLDATGIDPTWKSIDGVIPDSMLHEYDNKDVIEVALKYKFLMFQCQIDGASKANGIWVPVDRELRRKIAREGNVSYGTCDKCYASILPTMSNISDNGSF
jgi:hypothetical protein